MVTQAEDRYDSLIVYYAKQYGRNPKQVKRQVRAESNFDPRAISRCGAIGLCQFMPNTWREWHDATPGVQKLPTELEEYNAFNPEDSIRAGCAYMAALEKSFGELRYAIAAYNWGPGNVQRLIRAGNDEWRRQLPKETMGYLLKCLAYEAETLTVMGG